MRASGLKSYLSKPSRAVIASLILSVIAVLLMIVFKPVFPEKTAIYRILGPVGSYSLEPGESVDVRFKSFTEFDGYSVATVIESPEKHCDLEVKKETDGYYVITITNPGDDTLLLGLESPLVYESIDQLESGGTIDISLTKTGSPNGIIFAFTTLFTALFVFFISFAFLTDNLTPSKFYLIGAITLGLGVYPVLFPAWSTHDSDAHFQAAYRFSNILLGKGSDWVARACDVEFFKGCWKKFIFDGGYRPHPASDMYLPVVVNSGEVFVSAEETVMMPSDGYEYARMIFYGIFSYLPLSAGLALGRLLRMSPMYIIHLARYLQGAVFVFLTWRAVKRIKSENTAYLLALVSMFPMSLSYLTAFSYDGAVLTYLICALSLLICFKEDPEFWNKKNIIKAVIVFFLIGGVKGGAYVILIPMVFMLLNKPLKNRKNLLPVILMVTAFLSLLLNNVILKPRGEELFQLTGKEGFYSASFALQHPFRYLGMCLLTLVYFSGEMILDSVGRCEGWEEAVIPAPIIIGILLSAIVVVIASERVSRVTKAQAFSFLAACGLLLLTTPAMLLSDTPLSYILIMGVQGRYFRPIAPLIIVLISGVFELLGSKFKTETLGQIKGKAVAVKSAGLIVFSVMAVAAVIVMTHLYLGR